MNPSSSGEAGRGWSAKPDRGPSALKEDRGTVFLLWQLSTHKYLPSISTVIIKLIVFDYLVLTHSCSLPTPIQSLLAPNQPEADRPILRLFTQEGPDPAEDSRFSAQGHIGAYFSRN